MRNILLLTLITAGVTFGLSHMAFAVCQETGNTPSGGNIIECTDSVQNTPLNTGTNPGTTILSDNVTVEEGGGVDVAGSFAIALDDGDDFATVNGGIIRSTTNTALNGGSGNNVIIVNGGFLEGINQAIQTSTGMDDITINGGTLRVIQVDVIDASSGDDTITVNGGILDASFPGANEVLDASSGNDRVFLNGGTYFKGDDDETVSLSSGNDLLRFGADVDLDGGSVSCGTGFDTLIFAMDVPIERLNFLTNEILAANPSDDGIEINGISYTWTDCEQLVPDLNGVNFVRPIPTLSQWSLIAMAGLIGLAGLFVIRRRALT